MPFEESDAAKVAPNQKVRVSFDAIPDLQRDCTVLSFAPTGVNLSGVTNYYATILLTNTDPRLRSGLTAEAGVQVGQVDNALTVPNSAMIRQTGGTFVNVLGPNGTPAQREFQSGIVGADGTQVLSCLDEGPRDPAAPSSGLRHQPVCHMVRPVCLARTAESSSVARHRECPLRTMPEQWVALFRNMTKWATIIRECGRVIDWRTSPRRAGQDVLEDL